MISLIIKWKLHFFALNLLFALSICAMFIFTVEFVKSYDLHIAGRPAIAVTKGYVGKSAEISFSIYDAKGTLVLDSLVQTTGFHGDFKEKNGKYLAFYTEKKYCILLSYPIDKVHTLNHYKQKNPSLLLFNRDALFSKNSFFVIFSFLIPLSIIALFVKLITRAMGKVGDYILGKKQPEK